MQGIECEGNTGLETKRRTLVKAAVWQLLGFATMTLTGWIVTGSAAQGGAIAVTGAICGFVVYFLHERVWSQVRWGQLHTHDDGSDVANAPPAEEQTETGYGGPHRTTHTSVPEVCLARACLRRLNESSDTIATAEIRALGACEEPEYWLADRPRWLEADDDDRRRGEAHDPIVSRIARLREQTVTQSPVEIVARMLNYVGLRPIATGWGPDAMGATQRQRNLDAFLDLAVTYEDHCATQHEAATLTGFLVWLDHPSSPELDLQPVVTAGDAVHVLARTSLC